MSMERYMTLRAELARVRAQASDTQDEDYLLAEMDEVWRHLSGTEQALIRTVIAAERRLRGAHAALDIQIDRRAGTAGTRAESRRQTNATRIVETRASFS